MTIKNIALALLAAPAMANQHGEPEAAQPHFSVELAAGGCTMNGHVQSQTPNPIFSLDNLNVQDLKIGFKNQLVDGYTANVHVPLDILPGYKANWNRMIPLPSQMGFAGQFNMHWNYMCNGLGIGLYAGVGHNASRSSSTIPAAFDTNIQGYLYTNRINGPQDVNYQRDITKDTLCTMANNEAGSPLQARVAKTKNIPMGKATLSAGLMFQAGTRFGVMVGNAYPHMRLGWACLQFKANMTNQRTPWSNNLQVQANSTDGMTIFNTAPVGAPVRLLAVISNPDIDENNISATIGMGQYMDAFGPAYTMNNPIKIASKCQWTNAVTIGAGVDWAFHRMTVGFFYQVGICQKLTFKKWNKDVTAGLTHVDFSYVQPGQDIGAQGLPLNEPGDQSTGGTMQMQYGKSSTPEVSMRPIIHTAMVSVKYVLGKPA